MPAEWHDFATMIGGASGALTGLLFVAVSLNANRIAGHTGLRASAAQTLVLFITPLFIAVALLTPRQPRHRPPLHGLTRAGRNAAGGSSSAGSCVSSGSSDSSGPCGSCGSAAVARHSSLVMT